MKYYIVHPINEKANNNANDYRIITVKEADNEEFLKDYGDKIMASGESLYEVLLNFSNRNESGH